MYEEGEVEDREAGVIDIACIMQGALLAGYGTFVIICICACICVCLLSWCAALQAMIRTQKYETSNEDSAVKEGEGGGERERRGGDVRTTQLQPHYLPCLLLVVL